MALLVIKHDLEDYDAWRAVYDSMDEVQRQWGVTAHSVHQFDGAPNTVLVQHEFATVAQARGFLTNREILSAMQRGGVKGEPRVEIYT